MKNKLSIFIFRRDLRLFDNTALIKALSESDRVIPIFIFNKLQVENNEYKSSNIIEFMINSLKDLNEELKIHNSKLYTFYGDNLQILKDLKDKLDFDALYVNEDYTPFSIKRDKEIQEFCKNNNIEFNSCFDLLLNNPNKTKKADGNPYTVFTPFYKNSLQFEIPKPIKNEFSNYYNLEIDDTTTLEDIENKIITEKNPNLAIKGGRVEARDLMNKLKTKKDYKEKRDFPILSSTSYLSSHNKFGTISPREVFYFASENMPNSEPFIRQLYWRDFFTQIAYFFPNVFGNAFQKKYNNIPWENDSDKFEAWKKGKTGFPIVDAAMRELNITGYMHNRCRMIVASFLTKDLHIDWRMGEKYFAQKLIDYDPCVNNGSWQWAASTGCDAQPYFRIFNPWLQQKKFDESCEYIKKWLPDLKDLTPKMIHNLETQRPLIPIDYPKPIVEHQKAKETALFLFKEL